MGQIDGFAASSWFVRQVSGLVATYAGLLITVENVIIRDSLDTLDEYELTGRG